MIRQTGYVCQAADGLWVSFSFALRFSVIGDGPTVVEVCSRAIAR
jgi:hypothetical protein